MSNTIKGITIEIGGNTAPLDKALQGVNKTSRELQSELRSVERLLKFDPENTVLLTQKQSLLAKSIESTKEKLSALKEAEKQVQQQFERGEVTEEQFRALQREIVKSEQSLNKLENEASKAASGIDKIGKSAKEASQDLKKSEAAMEDFQNKVSGLGKNIAIGVAAISVATVAASKPILEMGSNFEYTMSGIKAVSGATKSEMAALEKAAIKAGAETKFSASETANAIQELIKAGLSVEDVINGGLDGALSLAAAGELEIAEAAEIAATALNAFKDDQISVAKAADILAGAANASATDVSELKLGLSQASAVASGMGMTFKDTSTALAVFAQNGLKGSDAGTSLKTMLLNLQPTTDKQAETFKKLGLLTKEGSSAFYDMNGHMKPLNEIAGLLQTSMKDLTDSQRALALESVFGSDAIRAGNILFKEGATGIDKMADSMTKFTAADVAKKRMDNLKGSLEELNGSLETAAIEIYNDSQDELKETIQDVTSIIKKNLPSIKQIVGDFFKEFISFGKWIFNNGREIISTISGIGAAMAVFKTAELIKAASISLKAYRVANEGATKAQWLMNAAVGANPMGILAAAIGAVVTAMVVYKATQTEQVSESEKLLDSVNKQTNAYNDLKNAQVEQGLESIAEIDNTQRLYEELQTLVDANGKVVGSKERVKFLTEEINKVIPDSIKLHEEEGATYADISKELDNLIAKKRAQVLLDVLEPQYKKALIEASKAQVEAIKIESRMIADQIEVKKKQAQYDAEWLVWKEKGFPRASALHMDSLAKELASLKGNLTESQTAYNGQKELIRGHYGDIALYEDTATKIATGHYEQINEANILLGKSYKTATDSSLVELRRQVDGAKEIYDKVVYEAGKFGSTITQRQVDDAKKYAAASYAEYRAAGGQVIQGLEDGMAAKNAELDVTGSTGRYAQKMKRLFADEMEIRSPSKVFSRYGGYIVAGLWEGINGDTDWLLKKVGGFASSIIKATKSALGIHSPSRVFRDLIGKNIVKGVGVGVELETPNLKEIIEDNMMKVTQGVQTTIDLKNNKMIGFGNMNLNNRQSMLDMSSKFERLVGILEEYFPEFANKMDRDIVLDDGTIVGKWVPKIDEGLGNRYKKKGRGN